MQSRRSARQSTGPRRRKVALACESCRERKSRCDGQKPICGPCARRSYPIDRCIYKSENARSASNDEYLGVLHRRIRQLEQACRQGGVDVSAFQAEDLSIPVRESGKRQIIDTIPSPLHSSHGNPANAADHGETSRTLLRTNTGVEDVSSTPRRECAASRGDFAYCSRHTDLYPSSPFEPRSSVTGMGSINAVGESERPQGQALANQAAPTQGRELSSLIHGDFNRSRLRVDDFFLPPRHLADHLLERFWDRIYCLYPFFDRASFQDAYDNLWLPRHQPGKTLSEQDIGLGNRLNSGTTSIVFSCALNIIFALGCHFADIPLEERQPMAHTFFLRAKQHIGLDLLDIRSVGVIQTVLIVAVYLQSTPYPHRCWSSIGVACRLAQGLGMHEAQLDGLKSPLEQEIHRRTWHGCVMMDKIVSMTYGRPSMTSHLPSVPLPEAEGLSPVGETGNPPLMAFYIATIELYQILDSILSDVYNAWRGRSSNTTTSGSAATKQAGLDVVIDLEERLFEYESNLPSFLSWVRQSTPAVDSDQVILDRQRNVLHARFLYLRFLYRPIFTRLCSGTYTRNTPASDQHSSLYSSMLSKCATACGRAAVDLVSLVHNTYQTSTTDTWWYNGFHTATAGIVLLMSYTAPSSAMELPVQSVDATWQKCEQILQHMAKFSRTAKNTLQFLSTAKTQILSNHHPDSHQHDPTMDSVNQHIHPPGRSSSTVPNIPNVSYPNATTDNIGMSQWFNWDSSLGSLPSDELGFLGPFDFSDFQGWLPEEIFQ